MVSKLTTELWKQKAKAIHGERYDYSQVDYKDAKTHVIVVCKDHGSWNEVDPKVRTDLMAV